MPRLLVSVRSEVEARAAMAGGAAIIDVKEPSRGSLGMASCSAWRRVRRALPPSMIVSVALGELSEWADGAWADLPGDCWSGIDFCKVGLAGAGPYWREDWRRLREWVEGRARSANQGEGPGWVAVVYSDWEAARAPEPTAVIAEASRAANCAGILFDTWQKGTPGAFDARREGWIERAKQAGRFVALAGSLDESTIRGLRRLEPEVFAVRGAACRDGDRNGTIDPERVARLAEAAGGREPSFGRPQASPMSNFTPWASGRSRP